MFNEMGSVIDLGPVHVRGEIRARYARVVYDNGTLIVVSKQGTQVVRQTLATDEPVPPDTPNGYWRANTPTGTVSWSKRGCAVCGSSPYKQANLGALSRQAIIDGF